jgi:hypothetical protein
LTKRRKARGPGEIALDHPQPDAVVSTAVCAFEPFLLRLRRCRIPRGGRFRAKSARCYCRDRRRTVSGARPEARAAAQRVVSRAPSLRRPPRRATSSSVGKRPLTAAAGPFGHVAPGEPVRTIRRRSVLKTSRRSRECVGGVLADQRQVGGDEKAHPLRRRRRSGRASYASSCPHATAPKHESS